MSPVLFELFGEPLRCGHRSHSSIAVRHGSDGRNVDDVTGRQANMKFREQKAIYADCAELSKLLNNTSETLQMRRADGLRIVRH
jgi:hypothetical protein